MRSKRLFSAAIAKGNGAALIGIGPSTRIAESNKNSEFLVFGASLLSRSFLGKKRVSYGCLRGQPFH